MENDTRIIKAISYLDGALSMLGTMPLKAFHIKQTRTRIRHAMTLLRNTKSDMRMINIEKDINLLKDLIIKNGGTTQ